MPKPPQPPLRMVCAQIPVPGSTPVPDRRPEPPGLNIATGSTSENNSDSRDTPDPVCPSDTWRFGQHEVEDFDEPARQFLTRFASSWPALARQIVTEYAAKKGRVLNPSAYIVATLIKAQHKILAARAFNTFYTAPHVQMTNQTEGMCLPGTFPPWIFDLAQYSEPRGLDFLNVHTLLMAARPQHDPREQLNDSWQAFEGMLSDGEVRVSRVPFEEYFGSLCCVPDVIGAVSLRASRWRMANQLVQDTKATLQTLCEQLGLNPSSFEQESLPRLARLDWVSLRVLVEHSISPGPVVDLFELLRGVEVAELTRVAAEGVVVMAAAHSTPAGMLENPPIAHTLLLKDPSIQNLLGELLYRQVRDQPGVGTLVGKITGMVLEMSDAVIQDLLTDPAALRAKVQ
eukprot:TRINITY_DN2371_c0_g1_i1.p1 TRINITY_DN2371_c0_g1~~TRINITY_DN2371_c0_g1_i1.p1  ORF type:complete len:400 (+),score=64.17 TRINITY_DN2371_c0_g1_i1:91-1290(+)